MARSTMQTFAGLGRSESSSASFLAASIVAEIKTIIFLISVIGTPQRFMRVEVGMVIIIDHLEPRATFSQPEQFSN